MGEKGKVRIFQQRQRVRDKIFFYNIPTNMYYEEIDMAVCHYCGLQLDARSQCPAGCHHPASAYTDKAPANKTQVGGNHYKGQELEHWDIVAMFDLDYFQGQITKYVMRWKKKNGVEDLEKAKHFLEKYIEVSEEKEMNEVDDMVEDAQRRMASGEKGTI